MTDAESYQDLHPFSVMAKVTGPICNLDCGYCFYLEKENLYPKETLWTMPADILESFIRQQFEARNSPAVCFAWQGGEPTLAGIDFFAHALELQKKYAGSKTVENVIQTNGVLLDDAWCVFLAKNKFLVGISIDGPKDIHDRYRRNRAGRGSFNEVMRGVELLKKHGVEFNTLTAVHRQNSLYPLDVYRFLKNIGSRFMQFIPIVERSSAAPTPDGLHLIHPHFSSGASVTEWSVEPLQYGTFLCSIFDEWVRHDIGTIFVQLFDVSLESWLGMQPGLCVFRDTCGDALVLEHNGDLYSCDHFVYPEYRLGNIVDQSPRAMASSERQRKFGNDKRDALPAYCTACPVKFACNGECPKHRFAKTPDGEEGLNYLCPGYKKFFHHIDYSMRLMADELKNRRPPANVMRWMNRMDTVSFRRNDPCYCGSGKKFKLCHGAYYIMKG